MRIYTSYIAKIKALRERGMVPVTICALPPAGCDAPNLAAVAPSKSILFGYKEDGDEAKYTERYRREILCVIQTDEQCRYFTELLESISHGKDVALCCFEKPGDFCHRHLLADYLNEKLGLGIAEYDFGEKPSSVCLF